MQSAIRQAVDLMGREAVLTATMGQYAAGYAGPVVFAFDTVTGRMLGAWAAGSPALSEVVNRGRRRGAESRDFANLLAAASREALAELEPPRYEILEAAAKPFIVAARVAWRAARVTWPHVASAGRSVGRVAARVATLAGRAAFVAARVAWHEYTDRRAFRRAVRLAEAKANAAA